MHLRVVPLQGDSGQATRLGVVPGVVPWRTGCEQPVSSDCAVGEDLAQDAWLAVGCRPGWPRRGSRSRLTAALAQFSIVRGEETCRCSGVGQSPCPPSADLPQHRLV